MYLSGFGNYHQTEALKDALPKKQNSPQKCPYGLYAEQLSGSAFTRPRHANLHSWLYRQLPSVMHSDYEPYKEGKGISFLKQQAPNPYRWSPFTAQDDPVDFLDGLFAIAGNAQVRAYWYQCTKSMQTRYFSSHDGELLFVPYLGKIRLSTELGVLDIEPGFIAVIPRGLLFKVELLSPQALGYAFENFKLPLSLPTLGIIGANGLANPRHFLYPSAAYEAYYEPVTLICKYEQRLWCCQSAQSPLNVVAWQGNYAPYCYDLSLFRPINTVSFDHPDPSIFTVLTSESNTPGMANLDFVLFPPRWSVAEHTFRPPYFHRNMMNEFMGLIRGHYEAKEEGFLPGGVSIHNRMVAHGPDSATYHRAIDESLKPIQLDQGLAFMFETASPWKISEAAWAHPARQANYSDCWQDFSRTNLLV